MRKSPPPTSVKTELTRDELRELFYRYRVMHEFRTGRTAVEAYIPSPVGIITGTYRSDLDENLRTPKANTTIRFQFEVFGIGNERWAAVTSDGMVIVPPFQFFGYAAL